MKASYFTPLRVCVLLSLLLFGRGAVMADDYKPLSTTDHITVSDVELVPGSGEQYDMYISLVGSLIYTAYEMDVKFPPGLDVVMNSEGKPYVYLYKKSDAIYPKDEEEDEWKHQVISSYGKVADHVMRLSCFSLTNAELTATSGTLLRVRVTPSAWLKPGDVTLEVSKLHFITKQDAQQYTCADQTLTLHASNQSSVKLSVSGDDHFNTCVLPFDVAALPEGLKAYSAKRVDDTNTAVVLDEVKSLKAYTPYILYAENGYTGTLTGTVDAANYVEVAHDGYLYGAVAAQKQTEGYVLQNQGEGSRFYSMADGEYDIPEGKCWLKVENDKAASASYALSFGDTHTGIATVPTAASTPKAIYTLDGIRVSEMQPGCIYVVDGQKILKL